MKERYTSEEISYEDAGVYTYGNDQLRHLIARGLSIVPKDVADRVFKECLFLMPIHHYEFGLFFPKEVLQNKCVIVFTEKLLEEDEKYIIRTVLHEIAHFYLSHKSSLSEDLLDEEMKKQEEEADRTANMWLREFEIDQNKNTAQK